VPGVKDRLTDAGYGLGWSVVCRLPESWAQRGFRFAADLAWRRQGTGVHAYPRAAPPTASLVWLTKPSASPPRSSSPATATSSAPCARKRRSGHPHRYRLLPPPPTASGTRLRARPGGRARAGPSTGSSTARPRGRPGAGAARGMRAARARPGRRAARPGPRPRSPRTPRTTGPCSLRSARTTVRSAAFGRDAWPPRAVAERAERRAMAAATPGSLLCAPGIRTLDLTSSMPGMGLRAGPSSAPAQVR
jgi:hypothetical protein